MVSPFLGISEWADPYSGLTFSKKAGIIQIPDGRDLTGIKKHIRLNQLIMVGGDLTSYVEATKPLAEAEQVDAKPSNVKEEVKQVEKQVEQIEKQEEEIPKEEVSKKETHTTKTSGTRTKKKN